MILDASNSFDKDGYIVSYTWDFSDGESSYGVKITHIYTNTGVYTVKLAVVDDEGDVSYWESGWVKP